MPAAINILDEDIADAEKLLLPAGKTFDAERRTFIRCLETSDLQAVPGSGKTTALMAKLQILDRYLPFADGSGLLVISHTNAAIDEINGKLRPYCQHLFSYPNFVGTIQTFVDQFLAIPYFVNRFGARPISIEQSSYDDAASRFMAAPPKGFTQQQHKMARHFLIASNCAATFRFLLINGELKLVTQVGGPELKIIKPRGNTLPKNYKDWTESEKQAVAKWLKAFKTRILSDGILCYDDAYFLASCYLHRIPQIKSLLQSRFRYVFVDEMQDMGKHQYDLLEQLFFDGGKSCSAYQRIGDRNQAIHSDTEVENVWKDRSLVLTLAKSHRLSASTAKVVGYFALNKPNGFEIHGLGSPDIKPHMLIYENDSRTSVVKRFSSILAQLIRKDRIRIGPDTLFKAIAWNCEWPDAEETHAPTKLRLVDFCPTFTRLLQESPINHNCPQSYLRNFDSKAPTLGTIEKSIVNLILKILRLEDVRNQENAKHFTGPSLLKHLRENHDQHYNELKLKLYNWSVAALKGRTPQILDELKQELPEILSVFGKELCNSMPFLAETPRASMTDDPEVTNTLNFDGFDIELGSVHSVKGRTHTATLYLESYFQKDGNGAKAKSYESQRLADQFLMNALTGKEGLRVKQSAKMVYVGFSRPTHLLAFAVHRDRFTQYLRDLDPSTWQIVEVNPEHPYAT
ncbi:MAG: UvrD-helicase domain-containing protein [Acidobacteria bacterium]|nr:UvrD-helicase domain-containing protein [Acidobacteriota bacterium]